MTRKHRAALLQIGKNIKTIRKDMGMRQTDLGRKTGIHHSDISRIENGLINIEVVTLLKIASALEVELKELV